MSRTLQIAKRKQEVLKHLVLGGRIFINGDLLADRGFSGYYTTRQFFGNIILSLEIKNSKEDEDYYEFGLFISDDEQEFQITGWNKWWYGVEAINELINVDFPIELI